MSERQTMKHLILFNFENRRHQEHKFDALNIYHIGGPLPEDSLRKVKYWRVTDNGYCVHPRSYGTEGWTVTTFEELRQRLTQK